MKNMDFFILYFTWFDIFITSLTFGVTNIMLICFFSTVSNSILKTVVLLNISIPYLIIFFVFFFFIIDEAYICWCLYIWNWNYNKTNIMSEWYSNLWPSDNSLETNHPSLATDIFYLYYLLCQLSGGTWFDF